MPKTTLKNSAILSLKAELLKKSERSSSSARPALAASTKPLRASLRLKKDKSDGSSKRRGASPERPTAEQEEAVLAASELRRSQQALERKAKIYDEQLENAKKEILSGARSVTEGFGHKKTGDDDDQLLNFKRHVLEFHDHDEAAKSYEEATTTGRKRKQADDLEGSPAPGQKKQKQTKDQSDPWVEYVDEFGRSRVVRKSEIERLESERLTGSEEESADASQSRPLPLPSAAVHPPPMAASAAARIHYSSTSEIRNLGVGFYQFSTTSETDRRRQQTELEALGEQTLAGRDASERRLAERERKRSDRMRKITNMRVGKFLDGLELGMKREEP